MERGVGKELARSAAGAAAAHHLASAMRRHVAHGHGIVVGSLRVLQSRARRVAILCARMFSRSLLVRERRTELISKAQVRSA
jgi:hypothetical protein